MVYIMCHNHACFIVSYSATVYHIHYALFPLMGKSHWGCVFVRFIAFAVACSSTFLRLPLQTFGYSDFALRANRVFSYVRKLLWYISLLLLYVVGRWVGLAGLHPCADVLAGGFTWHLYWCSSSRVMAQHASATWQVSACRFCNCINSRKRHPYDCAATLCSYALSTRCFSHMCCSASP